MKTGIFKNKKWEYQEEEQVNGSVDSLIECAYLLSMKDGKAKVQTNQVIAVKDGQIDFVGPVPAKSFSVKKIIKLKNHIVCPGLINTHTHLPMVLFRGLGDHFILQDWLNKVIFPLEKKMICPEFIRTGTELAVLELIQNGITTVCDMYFHTHIMAEVLDSFGLRGVLAVDMLNSFSDSQTELDIIYEKYQKNNRIYPAIGCHAPYTCSSEVLKFSVKEAERRNLPLSIHVAETKWEIDYLQKKYGQSPVKYLQSLGIAGPHCIFAHGVHLNEEELDLMAQAGTALSYNPESNMKLGSGTAPILKALKKGIPVGLGTDGSASNNNLNLFAEMDTAAKLQKLNNPNEEVRAEDVFSMATVMGAKALGLSHCLGQIKEGFCADIIAVNLNYPHFYPKHDLLNHLVYSASGQEVDFVMCQGRVLMENSEIFGVSNESIYRKAEDIKHKIQNVLNP